MRCAARIAAIAFLLAGAVAATPRRNLLDGADPAAGWVTAPSEGVALALSSEGAPPHAALRLDFDFRGHAGWAAARLTRTMRLPENWAFELRLRGDAPAETLEFKLLDPTGQNVWWSVRRDFAFPRDGTTLRIRKRQVAFAWGPAGGGEIRELGAIEVTITAGSGGKGTVWLEELAFEELPPASASPPPATARASSSREGNVPERAVDRNANTSWEPDGRDPSPELVLDLHGHRELGGLTVDWDDRSYPRRYFVELSEDSRTWTASREVSPSSGGRDWIDLPDAEAAFVRLRLESGASDPSGASLREIRVEPPSFSESPTAFLESVARDSPRGLWPRSFRGEQLYWSLVGLDGGVENGLLSEDGALETGRGSFSLEPFVEVDGRLLGWAEAEITHALADGDLPIPTVRRAYPGGLALEVTALADGAADAPRLWARYRLSNFAAKPRRAALHLTIRPLQVNPPWQFLSTEGGFSPIRRISPERTGAIVEGRSRTLVLPLTGSSGLTAAPFRGGDVVSWLARGVVPPEREASDADGFASGEFTWDLELAAEGTQEIVVVVPLAGAAAPEPFERPGEASAAFEARLSAARSFWRAKLESVKISLPPEAKSLQSTVRSSLAWILVNRRGPAIRPGTRSYARSWIRDGALTGAALLRLGHAEEVRDFLRWFAPYQFESGAVPCCVDGRGADPVPENDSHGELLYLAAEYLRFTGDRQTLESLWPHLSKAAAYIDELRRRRQTDEYRAPDKLLFFGLLPESISHEGYSSHPVHSYWDDFWGIRGLSDAAEIARALGRNEEAAVFTASREEMREDVEASLRRVIAARGLDYIPGSADLGDFDATSTTIALEPCGEGARLLRRELDGTFERYWTEFVARRDAKDPKGSYTPYEWRVAGSFLRLGRPDRAQALFEYFLADRRPEEWNQWAEVVYRDPRAPKFIGDMPHGWVASDFLRSFLDLFAWEREEDGSLVVASGLPPAWLRSPGGVSIRGLRTRWGSLDVSVRRQGRNVLVDLGGRSKIPPGGFVVRPPLKGPVASLMVDGKPASGGVGSGDAVVRKLPARIWFRESGGDR